ncbi:SpaA isopeptide-forming pilin-related protein [Methanobrevibacter sp.]|uniref:SpaA isopeptide-forming pilin-related protein n=1 Tax=Methanobrevibacter sp. TaxID=66852 RepID=UPI00388E7C0A
MFKKGLMIIFLLLLTMGFVHADDINETSMDYEVELTDSPIRSYTDLSNHINDSQDSIIELSENYKYNSSSDAQLIDGVRISKNITLTSKNDSYIDGSGLARGLFIDSYCNVVLENITFKNGYSSSSGGGVFLGDNSNLTIKNCYFYDNLVYNSNGGALYASRNTDVEILNSTLINNTSIRVSDLEWKSFKAGMGSTICSVIGSTLKLIDSVFKDNNAYLATVLLVSYNDVDYDLSNLFVKNCLFENNTAVSSGVIYLDELGQGEILDSVFRSNVVKESGGTIILDASIYALVKNCLFEENFAPSGGAIRIKSFNFEDYSHVSIVDCNFTGNNASEHAGAIFSKFGFVNITNCNFCENSASERGGAIYSKNGTIEIFNSTFNNNSASYGGAVFSMCEENLIHDSLFVNNTAVVNGGAFYSKYDDLENNSNVVLFGCDFYDNSASERGGAVYSKEGTIEIFCSTFNNNSANYGGALYLNTESTVNESLFTNNNASIKGGAIYSKIESVSSSNCKYFNNSAPAGDDIYGIWHAQITVESSYWGDVRVRINLSLPWNTSLLQNVKLKFIGLNNYSSGWLELPSDGILLVNGSSKMTLGNYSLALSIDSGVCIFSPINLSVVKAPSKVVVKNLTTSYNSGKVLKIYLKNNVTNNPLKGIKLNLKVYTGKDFENVTLKTDDNGVIEFDTSNLSIGVHKIKITSNCTDIKLSKTISSIKIKKISAKIVAPNKVKRPSKLKIKVLNKNTGKAIGKIKLNVKIYTGKYYKSVKVKTSSKGIFKLATKKLTKGKHKISVKLKNEYYAINNEFNVKIK